ncbi:MAG: MlaE family ABC transporter permease [Commensalibacter sp.]
MINSSNNKNLTPDRNDKTFNKTELNDQNVISSTQVQEAVKNPDKFVELVNRQEAELNQNYLSWRLKQADKASFPFFKKMEIIVVWSFLSFIHFIGKSVRSYCGFLLDVLGASYGVIIESFFLYNWRRTTRYEFVRILGQSLGGGLFSTVFTASLTGLAVVSQAVYWLGLTGLSKMTAPILVTVILRELSPIFVGMILLGRNGILSVAECSLLATGGQLRTYNSIGIDPFVTIVLPRAWAFTVSSFALGMIFGTVSLFTGYLVTFILGSIKTSIWSFYSDILFSMAAWDYVTIPLKFLISGFLIGIGSCITGMNAKEYDDPSTLLPKGFTRGIMLIMVVNVLFTLDF